MELKYDHLLGREYIPGSVHCYALVREFYRDNFDIALNDYPLPVDWDADALDLIGLIHEREGFFKVEDWTLKTLQPGDLMCVAVGSTNANHFVIYIGNNHLLHHPLSQKSRVEPMRDFWRKQTCFVLRRPDVPNLTPPLPDIDILDLINERYRPQPEG